MKKFYKKRKNSIIHYNKYSIAVNIHISRVYGLCLDNITLLTLKFLS